MTTRPKAPKDFMAFRPEPELALAMAKLKDRDGISVSEQIRRALREWLAKKGTYTPKKEKR
jgi:hypothetical protein